MREFYIVDPTSTDWPDSIEDEREELTAEEIATACEHLTPTELVKFFILSHRMLCDLVGEADTHKAIYEYLSGEDVKLQEELFMRSEDARIGSRT